MAASYEMHEELEILRIVVPVPGIMPEDLSVKFDRKLRNLYIKGKCAVDVLADFPNVDPDSLDVQLQISAIKDRFDFNRIKKVHEDGMLRLTVPVNEDQVVSI